MRDTDMHLFAGLGALVGATLIVLPAALGGGNAAVASTVPDDLIAISASLAFKSNSNNQPQKNPVRQPPRGGATTPTPTTATPPPNTEGVGTDKPLPPATKPSTTTATGSAAPKADDGPATMPGADDGPTTDPGAEPVGDFNGSEYGFDQFTSGDPFFQQLKGDLITGWEYPAILNDGGTPVGCLHVSADGTIPEVVMKEQSGIAELDDSVERQLQRLSKLRNEDPIPVPSHLLAAATTRWVCFKFNPKS